MASAAIALLFNMVLPTRASTCSANWTASSSPLFTTLHGLDVPARASCTPHHHSPPSLCIQSNATQLDLYEYYTMVNLATLSTNASSLVYDETNSQHKPRLYEPGIHQNSFMSHAFSLMQATMHHVTRFFECFLGACAKMPPPATTATPPPSNRGQSSVEVKVVRSRISSLGDSC